VSVPASTPERLVCDTSFVGASAKRAAQPQRFAHWSNEVLDRVDGAILAISVITLAEARYGYLNAGWGTARIEREERRLASFLQLPLDPTVIDEWARLKDLSHRNGWNVTDNDLWIAATAAARSHPLLTCDKDQARIDDSALEVVYLPMSS
jgi:predicted nucleic acid-binding protein